jgi:hypothetical protein
VAFDSASGPEGAHSCSRPDDNACPNRARLSRAEQTRKAQQDFTTDIAACRCNPSISGLLLAYNQWLLLAYMLFRMAIRRSLTATHAQPRFSWRPRVSKAAASALQHVTGLHFQPIRFDYSAHRTARITPCRCCGHSQPRLSNVLCCTHKILSPRPLGLGMGWWRPASRSRLVTGCSRRGAPFSVTAGHVAAGRVTAVTTPDQRPRPLPLATPESLSLGRSLARPNLRSKCAARVAKPA